MSKRIDYNNDNNIAPADRAVIVPDAAPNSAPATAKSSKMTKGAKTLAIILIVVAVCAIAILALSLIVNSFVSKINTPHYEDAVIEIAPEISNGGIYTPVFMDSEVYKTAAYDALINYAEASHNIKSDEKIYNFAVYGINTFESNEKGLATFIMVASFNSETKKITFASFEEQILVYIPMVGVGELRDAYEWGGSALLTKTIKYNFGVDINGYIEIDMTMAAELIDSIGGVAVSNITATDIAKAIDSYNKKFNINVTYPDVSNGKATLNGLQAIAYLRSGFNGSSAVLTAMGKAIFGNGLKGMINSFNVICGGTKTSLLKDDLIALAEMSLLMVKNAETSTIHVGADKTLFYVTGRDFSFYMNDPVAERTTLVNALYGAPVAE